MFFWTGVGIGFVCGVAFLVSGVTFLHFIEMMADSPSRDGHAVWDKCGEKDCETCRQVAAFRFHGNGAGSVNSVN